MSRSELPSGHPAETVALQNNLKNCVGVPRPGRPTSSLLPVNPDGGSRPGLAEAEQNKIHPKPLHQDLAEVAWLGPNGGGDVICQRRARGPVRLKLRCNKL